MDIYYSDKKDIQPLYQLWQKYFKDPESFAQYYFKEKLKDNQILVVMSENQLISMTHLNPYDLILCGKQIKSDYIVGVVTEERYRRQGYMAAMMHKALQDMYHAGKCFTFLMPAKESLYTGFGFRYICKRAVYQVEFPDLGLKQRDYCFIPADGNAQEVWQTLAAIHRECHSLRDLCVSKDVNYFERMVKETASEGGKVIAVQKDKQWIGYFIYCGDDNEVMEAAHVNEKAKELIDAMAEYFAGQKAAISVEENCIAGRILEEEYHGIVQHKPNIMGRIVNAADFIRHFTLKPPYENEVVELYFHIIDNIIPENQGGLHVRFSREGTQVWHEEHTQEPAIRLTTYDLLLWLTGDREWLSGQAEQIHIRELCEMKKVQCLEQVYIHEIV